MATLGGIEKLRRSYSDDMHSLPPESVTRHTLAKTHL
jgi:hypothetical protein